MIDLLLDEGSFSEVGRNSGFGTIDERPVCVYHFKGVFEGCSGEVVDLALKTGVPLIVVLDCEGMRVSFKALSDLAGLVSKLSVASGVIPRITVVSGRCHGSLCYTLGDFVVALKSCELSVVMPDTIKLVTGKDVNVKGDRHSGNVHFLVESEEEASEVVKRLLSYLPLNNMEDPPIAETTDDPARQTEEISGTIPEDPHKVYDVRNVIKTIVDDGDFMEIQPGYAENAVIGFGRLDGVTVGIVANNPMFYAGCIDLKAAEKISKFVRFCDAFNIPVLTLVDTPGFLPDVEQELSGLPKYASKILQAYSEATVPLVTVVLRKAYGPALVAMGSKFVGADIVYAYPNSEFAVIDLDTDAKMLGIAKDEYLKEAGVERALDRGFIDSVIDPKWTRSKIINALRMLETKRKKLPPKKCSTW